MEKKKTRKPLDKEVILNINQISAVTPKPHIYYTLSWQFPNHRHMRSRYTTVANAQRTAENLVAHIQKGGIKISLPEGFKEKVKKPKE